MKKRKKEIMNEELNEEKKERKTIGVAQPTIPLQLFKQCPVLPGNTKLSD